MWIFVSSFRENGRVCIYLKMEVLYFGRYTGASILVQVAWTE